MPEAIQRLTKYTQGIQYRLLQVIAVYSANRLIEDTGVRFGA